MVREREREREGERERERERERGGEREREREKERERDRERERERERKRSTVPVLYLGILHVLYFYNNIKILHYVKYHRINTSVIKWTFFLRKLISDICT